MSSIEARDRKATLLRELGLLHRRTAKKMRAARARSALARGVDRVLPLLILVPVAWILLRLLGGRASVDGLLLIPATILIPALVLLALTLAAFFRGVGRRESLAILDRELDLEDRLQTADEFLGSGESSSFIEAALEDAASFLPRAREAEFQLPSERWRIGGRAGGILATSLVLLILAGWIGDPAEEGVREPSLPGAPPADSISVALREAEPDTHPTPPEPRDPRRDLLREDQAPAGTESITAHRDRIGELSEVTEESVGKTGEGRSSDAESTSGASESRGVPSNQAQTSKAAQEPSKKKAKKRRPKPRTDEPTNRTEKQEEESGSTAGKGSSRGSNRNPAASSWSSKDQVTSEDDQELEDDEDTEDEEEAQESRGGVQPNLRGRKPPVSRDLRIGFGNEPDPDANGRGGPSELKKSRGTASLVLGVPIPDRVKGQPNPGKTKITQERIEPRAETSSPIEAATRTARQAPIGHLQRRDLTPWMRTLVREYFLTLRYRRDEP
jgi:hypothetical protein